MIRKLLSQLAFCIFLVMGLSCSFAFAEEVEIEPVDSVSGGFLYNYGYPDQTFVSFNSKHAVPTPDPNRWYGGTQLSSSDYTVLYDPEYVVTSSPNESYYSEYLSQVFGPFDHTTLPNSFILGMPQCSIDIDTTGYLSGYYRYECDFFFGLQLRPTFMSQASGNGYVEFQPEFTYYADPYENNMGVITTYMGRTNTINHLNGFWSRGVSSDLIQLHVEYTFYCDGNTSTVSLSPDFSVLGALTYDCISVRAIGSQNSHYSNDCSMFLNTRFTSKLYSNVEPPITPTPSPTPYPGQDTQESINSGVQQIVQDLNVYATPIPTPADLTIDETVVDVLETMTLPDLTDSEATFSSLWEIFTPAVWFLALMASSIFVVSIFLWILRGGWL